jgi:hypothetical protein
MGECPFCGSQMVFTKRVNTLNCYYGIVPRGERNECEVTPAVLGDDEEDCWKRWGRLLEAIEKSP